MTTVLTTDAQENSTYVVVAAFTDEEGVAVVPTSVTWTLTKMDATVINSRSAVVIAAAASVSIVLSGADLDPDDGLVRLLTVEAVYDSALGTGLPLKQEAVFHLEDLRAV